MKTLAERIMLAGPLAQGERVVYVRKRRAPYVITVDGELYYQAEVREIDEESDFAIIRRGADRVEAKRRCASHPPWNR